MITTLFSQSRLQPEGYKADLPNLVGYLQKQRQFMHDQSIQSLITFFDRLVKQWEKIGLIKKNLYLNNIADFLREENLTETVKLSLRGNEHVLDKFVDLGSKKILYHAQPRGLTVQWLAGNVSVLGLFSIFSALITKNVCLIKASSRGYQELTYLLNTLTHVKTQHINGKDLTRSIAVILVDRDDLPTHHYLSSVADVRVAWGGKDAITILAQLPKKTTCEDIIFGPKYSYAVIDAESIKTHSKKLAQRLAIDVSVFDQYACSSPHTVFIEGSKKTALTFAAELGKQMEFINRTLIPKGPIDPKKAIEILGVRAKYAINATVIASSGTLWTVICTVEAGLASGCFSRVIFVKPIKDIAQLNDYNDRGKQTLAVALTSENKKRYLDKITINGIDRCPDIGAATFYEQPWDGMFVFDRLVRWVSTYQS